MSTGRPDAVWLVADIGGTHARFALAHQADGALECEHELRTSDYPSIDAAIARYLKESKGPHPVAAALAMANPVVGDHVRMTNNSWSFSRTALQSSLALERLVILNDFEALALSLEHLPPDALRRVGPVAPGAAALPLEGATRAVVGPGTGLGMAGVVYLEGAWRALPSEGGHTSAAAETAREMAVVALLQQRWGHVSWERLVSGPGLVNLYQALTQLDGVVAEPLDPAGVSARGVAGSDRHCREALELFCAFLGGLAGDQALMLVARGGVYLGGGILPEIADFLLQSAFRTRFESKGRMRALLEAIPTHIILAPHAAMSGCWVALARQCTP